MTSNEADRLDATKMISDLREYVVAMEHRIVDLERVIGEARIALMLPRDHDNIDTIYQLCLNDINALIR